MSKFLKGVKRLFIVEESETTKTNDATSAETPDRHAEHAQLIHSKVEINRTIDASDVNDRFLEVLFDALEHNNKPGLDYLEFRQSVRALDKMPMEEEVKFHSAFAMAQSMGASADQLVDSAAYYIQVLQNEEQKFNDSLQRQVNEQVIGREQDMKAQKNRIAAIKEQIAALLKEMELIEANVIESEDAVEAAKLKIETARAEFHKANQHIQEQIKNDITKINRFLQKKK
jgi:hypothetical protein